MIADTQADKQGRSSLRGVSAFVATGFYSGLFPFASGTVGSAVALPFYFGLRAGGDGIYALGLAAFVIGGIYAADVTERRLRQVDPSCVVVDEMAGMLLTLLLLPFSWGRLVTGFLLFRLFDILKPFPARRLERLPGGWGIMLDDLVAALYANLVLRVAWRFLA